MALTAGTRLGPYEILFHVGSGGMGEVYRARDPRLGRDVAVKVISTDGTVALDAGGRWAATAACYAPERKDRLLHVVDRRTGEARAYPLPGTEGEAADSGSVQGLRFVQGGRLVASGWVGLHRWDPETGRNEALHASPCGPMDVSADGLWVLAACKPAEPGQPAPPAESPL